MSETPDTIGGAAESGSDTPEIAEDSGLLGGGLPRPTRRQAVLLGLALAVIVAILLIRRQNETADNSEPITDAGEIEPVEQSETGEEIEIEPDPSDPLAVDEQVTEAMQERGRIGDSGEDTAESEG